MTFNLNIYALKQAAAKISDLWNKELKELLMASDVILSMLAKTTI